MGFDETLTVNGEILARFDTGGVEFCRFLKVDSEPESRIEELMQRHVVNWDKVR